MDFTIQDIIDDIINEGFWERCEKTINDSLMNYKLEKNNVKNERECTELLNDFMTHFFYREKAKEVDADSRHIFGNVAREYFKSLYKDKYITIIYSQMIYGTDGGIYKILKQLMNLLFEDTVTRHINRKVAEYIKDLEIDDLIKLSEQYFSKYVEYLPKSLSSSPVLIALKLDEVILEHIKTEKKIGGSIA